jgi:hypothetical protein
MASSIKNLILSHLDDMIITRKLRKSGGNPEFPDGVS